MVQFFAETERDRLGDSVTFTRRRDPRDDPLPLLPPAVARHFHRGAVVPDSPHPHVYAVQQQGRSPRPVGGLFGRSICAGLAGVRGVFGVANRCVGTALRGTNGTVGLFARGCAACAGLSALSPE